MRAQAGLGIERIGRLHLLGAGHQLFQKLVLHFALDEQARPGIADFAFAIENPGNRALHGAIDIGIGEDDVRRLAAELQRDALHGVGRTAHDFLADLGRSGKRNLVDAGMAHHGAAHLGVAGDDVDHTRRNSGFHRQFTEAQRSKRSLAGRLQHHGIAAGQRRTEFPR